MKTKPIRNIAIGLWIFLGLIFIITLFIPQDQIDISKAKAYKIVGRGDFSFPGRERLEWFIVSDAKTKEERAQTVIKAAIELQEESGADVVNIMLEPDSDLVKLGYTLAIADFAPDKCGYSGNKGWEWRVESSVDQFSEDDIIIARIWRNNKEKFRSADGGVDEEKLKQFISDQRNISIEQVVIPWISRSNYQIKTIKI